MNDSSISERTPVSWIIHDTWEFHFVDPGRNLLGTIVLRLTDKPIETCSYGEWRQATFIGSTGQDLNKIAQLNRSIGYQIIGSFINVDLDAGICDANTILRGELVEGGGSGRVDYFHFFGGEHVGWFTATPQHH